MNATSITELTVPTDLNYGWLTEFEFKYKINGPTGHRLVTNPRNDEPTPERYLNAGFAGVQTAAGVPSPSIFLTPQQKFVLSGRGTAANGPQGEDGPKKQFRDYTDADTDGVVCRALTCIQGGGAMWYTGDYKEVYDGSGFYEQDNPTQFVRFHRLMGQGCAALGLCWYGDYDGDDLINNNLADQNMWAGLNSPNAALQYLLSRPYYRYELWKYGCGTISNHYVRGAPGGGHERMWEHTAQIALTTLARQQIGVNFPVLAYQEGTFNEFTGVTTEYIRTLPSGGHVYTTGDGSGISFGLMLAFNFNIALCLDSNSNFAGPEMYGRNPNIIQNDALNQWGAPIFRFFPDGTGNNPLRSNSRPWYDYVPNDQFGQHGGPYPNKPLGFEDTMPIGTNIAGECERHVGTKNFIYPSILMDGTNYVPGPGHSFLKTIRDNKLPWIKGYRNPQTGNGWYKYYYNGGKTPKNAILTLGPVDIPVRMVPGAPQYFKFTSPVTY